MTRQTNLDLRAAFAAAVSDEAIATQHVAPVPARERINPIQPLAAVREANGPGRDSRPYITEGRKNLVRRMLEERYPAEEAAARYAAIGPKWATMTPAQYQAGLDRLKGLPKLTAPVAPPVRQEPAPSVVRITGEIIEGTHTIVFEGGEYAGQHVTIEALYQGADENFMPGRMILSYLSGSDNEGDYTQFAHVGENGLINVWKKHRGNARLAEAVKVLAGDPRATMLAYGRMSRRCGKAGCGRKLTHPDSIERGMSRQHAAELGLL
jgi:hypothetical protein